MLILPAPSKPVNGARFSSRANRNQCCATTSHSGPLSPYFLVIVDRLWVAFHCLLWCPHHGLKNHKDVCHYFREVGVSLHLRTDGGSTVHQLGIQGISSMLGCTSRDIVTLLSPVKRPLRSGSHVRQVFNLKDGTLRKQRHRGVRQGAFRASQLTQPHRMGPSSCVTWSTSLLVCPCPPCSLLQRVAGTHRELQPPSCRPC